MPFPLVIRSRWALGDTVLMTALPRDIHRAYPGQYTIGVEGNWKSVWKNNPNVVENVGPNPRVVTLEYYQGIRASSHGSYKKHFLTWLYKDFEQKTAVAVPLTEPHGDLHLPTGDEPRVSGRYWVVVAGGKTDMTTKIWYHHRYQEVVDRLKEQGIDCVQTGAMHRNNIHPPLRNCLSALGKTEDVWDFFSLIAHADGVICGITSAMHIAACFNKPCVVVAGGREEPWWEGYANAGQWTPGCAPVEVPHKFLHTVNLLHCCQGRGCWKDKVALLTEADRLNAKRRRQLCALPVMDPVQAVPQCMTMIETDHVVEAVMDYYDEGVLPPIGKPRGAFKKVVSTPAELPNPYEQMWEEAATIPPPAPDVLGPLAQARLAPDRLTELLKEPPRFTRPFSAPARAVAPTPPQPILPPETALIDHPLIGGKFTVCVLCYGDHFDLAARCIDSILTHTKDVEKRLDIRVGLNQVCGKTEQYLYGFNKTPFTKIYSHPENAYKYPVMREMFWDATCPIVTNWVLWFDDDSHVIDPNWLTLLCESIVNNHSHGCRMFGTRFVHDILPYAKGGHRPDKWFREADWYRGRPFFLKTGDREAPNGSYITFATGGFWALSTDIIRVANIPDVRLKHNGGDITIGEQVHQAGYKIKDFCRGKTPVAWSAAKRRGYHENFPWSVKPA